MEKSKTEKKPCCFRPTSNPFSYNVTSVNKANKELLYNAMKWGHWEKSRKILHQEKAINHLVEYTGEQGWNALHWACICETPPDVWHSLLAASPAKAIMTKDEFGSTPLHWAMEYCSEEIIIKMIETCPEVSSVADYDGWTPFFHVLTCNKSEDVIRAILTHYPSAVMDTDPQGNTPLDLFFHDWDAGLRSIINSITEVESSIMHLRVIGENKKVKTVQEIFKITILLLRATLHGTIDDTSSSFRPLHAAINLQNCPLSFFRLLLKIQPDEAHQQDERGNFTLHIAASTKSFLDDECCGCESQSKTTFWHQCQHLNHEIKLRPNCFLKQNDDGWGNGQHFLGDVEKYGIIIEDLIAANPHAANFPNHDGRLPLNLAVEQGKSYEQGGVKAIFHASPESVSTRDIKTHMYPFMLAAVGQNEKAERNRDGLSNSVLKKLTTVYELVSKNPALITCDTFEDFVERKHFDDQTS